MHSPGVVRDGIVAHLRANPEGSSLQEIITGVLDRVGYVPSSSVRSYLLNNTPGVFERTERGRYRLRVACRTGAEREWQTFLHESATLVHADCFEWLAQQPNCSVHAVLTDPPYGLVEYTPEEQSKLRTGRGGVWRVPPSFDGHTRAPLPRFTTLSAQDRRMMKEFFTELGSALFRVCVPGANILIASNPLLSHDVTTALEAGGLEPRGAIIRRVMTMRGGDRPKNAHKKYSSVSVMPRSTWEPWICLRKPIEGRVQDNLEKWGTGGFKRVSKDQPFTDSVQSAPTSKQERMIVDHPSLKPQKLMRHFVRSVLPLNVGTILDPFAGGGSTLAAAVAIGHQVIGIERDSLYFEMASKGLADLSNLSVEVDPL